MNDVAELSFEQAMQELEIIVRKLESGEATPEDSLKDYMRGTKLKEHCQKTLMNAKLQVEQIMKRENGEIATEPFEA